MFVSLVGLHLKRQIIGWLYRFIDRENELRQSKPPTPQPPQRAPLDPFTRSKLCKQYAPPKEDKKSSEDENWPEHFCYSPNAWTIFALGQLIYNVIQQIGSHIVMLINKTLKSHCLDVFSLIAENGKSHILFCSNEMPYIWFFLK